MWNFPNQMSITSTMWQAAEARLDGAGRLLAGEHGAGRLARLRRGLVARRCRMVVALAAALELGFRTG